jgi:hypothetical protein
MFDQALFGRPRGATFDESPREKLPWERERIENASKPEKSMGEAGGKPFTRGSAACHGWNLVKPHAPLE